jgi:DNA-directed RNA polymerase alpha subunit/DNA-directed RNA polymerase subunit L
MNPTISNISDEAGVYKFTLDGLNVSLANSIRRTILSDIPINVIKTETYAENQCNILINTTRLHNEILKHRLSCIPIHITELELLPDNYVLEVDVNNETEHLIYVTTEHFKIRNKSNGNYLTENEIRKIFPMCSKTNSFIEFARLRPKISDGIPGEQLKLEADFSIGTAKDNSMFNVVSKCSYGNTLDTVKINEMWEEHEAKLKSNGSPQEDIEFEKKNYYLLDAQRQFVPDSFDFVIQSIGIYENIELVKKACIILQNKMVELITAIDSDIVPINISETTMEHSYDIVLENEDYTVGKVLEYLLYDQFYLKDKILSFCGFKKFHPHNTDSIIRIAYIKPADKNMVRQHLKSVCVDAADVYKKIYKLF